VPRRGDRLSQGSARDDRDSEPHAYIERTTICATVPTVAAGEAGGPCARLAAHGAPLTGEQVLREGAAFRLGMAIASRGPARAQTGAGALSEAAQGGAARAAAAGMAGRILRAVAAHGGEEGARSRRAIKGAARRP